MVNEMVMAQLHDWYKTVPPDVQQVFEQIWVDAPQVLLHALNADAAAPDIDTDRTFAEWVEVDSTEGRFDSRLPSPSVYSIQVRPERPNPNAEFKVSWVVHNQGKADLPARADLVVLYDGNQGVVSQVGVQGAAVPAGGQVAQEATLTAPDQAQPVTVVIWVNPEGADEGQVPGPVGFRAGGSVTFEVGVVMVEDWGLVTAVEQAYEAFTMVSTVQTRDELVYKLGQGLALLERVVREGYADAVSDEDKGTRDLYLQFLGRSSDEVEGMERGLRDEDVPSITRRLSDLGFSVMRLRESDPQLIRFQLDRLGDEIFDGLYKTLAEARSDVPID
jgi:hypothetical protein